MHYCILAVVHSIFPFAVENIVLYCIYITHPHTAITNLMTELRLAHKILSDDQAKSIKLNRSTLVQSWTCPQIRYTRLCVIVATKRYGKFISWTALKKRSFTPIKPAIQVKENKINKVKWKPYVYFISSIRTNTSFHAIRAGARDDWLQH